MSLFKNNFKSSSVTEPADMAPDGHGTMHSNNSTITYTTAEKSGFNAFKKVEYWLCGFPYSSIRARRFCGNRFNFNQCMGISICVSLFLIITVIVIPVIYCVVVPNSIQARFDQMVQSGEGIIITPLANLTKEGNNMVVNLKIPPFTFLSGQTSLLGPMFINLMNNPNAKVASSANAKPWGFIKFPTDLTFEANKNANLTFDALFNITDIPSLMAAISRTGSSKPVVYVKTSWSIKMWGTVWYRNLPLSSRQTLSTNGTGMTAQLFNLGQEIVMNSLALATTPSIGTGTAAGTGNNSSLLSSVSRSAIPTTTSSSTSKG